MINAISSKIQRLMETERSLYDIDDILDDNMPDDDMPDEAGPGGILPSGWKHPALGNFINTHMSDQLKEQLNQKNRGVPVSKARDSVHYEKSLIEKLDHEVLGLLALGHTPENCLRLIRIMNGITLPPTYVRDAINKYQENLGTWLKRSLNPCYPFLFVSCLYPRTENDSAGIALCFVYMVIGITPDGQRELVHLYPVRADDKSAGDAALGAAKEHGSTDPGCGVKLVPSDWKGMFNGLKQRGLKDVMLINCNDDPKIAAGAQAVYPQAHVQFCLEATLNACTRALRSSSARSS